MLLRAMSKGIGDRKYRDGAGLSMRKIIAVSIAAGSLVILADRSQAADRDGGDQRAAVCAAAQRRVGENGGMQVFLGRSPGMHPPPFLEERPRARPSHIMRAIA